MMTLNVRRTALTTFVGIAFAFSAAAQQTPSAPDTANPTSTPDATEDEDIVTLSPFVVDASKDTGYRATNSISGTRLNTRIKDMPTNLEVITDEFIRDTGATNLREALRYSSGVVLDSQADAFTDADGDWKGAGANDPRGVTRRAGDSTTKMRGFVIDQVLRDGFRRQYSADSINIGRVEVQRGPAALLYGVGSLGGVINFLPKRPELKPAGSLNVSIGSYGLIRTDFDSTGPIGNSEWKPAYRLTGVYEDGGDHTQYYNSRRMMLAPVISFRPFPNTEVVLDNEVGYTEQTGVGFQNLRSNLNAGADRTASWLTDVSGGRINNRTFRWSGPDTYQKGPFNNHVIDLTQKIGDNLFIKAGYNYTRTVWDTRQIRDTGTSTEPFIQTLPVNFSETANLTLNGTAYSIRDALTRANASADGKFEGYTAYQIYTMRPAGSFRGDRLYGFVANDPVQNRIIPSPPDTRTDAAIRYQWHDSKQTEERDQIRVDANYKLDLGKLGTHNFVVGAQYMEAQSVEDLFSPGYSYPGHSVLDIERFSYHNPADYSPFRYGIQGDGRPDAAREHLYNTINRTWDAGYYAVYQGQFFKDRVTLIGGMRRDRNDRRSVRDYIYESEKEDEVTLRVSPKAPTANSPQAGISIAVTPDISIFGLYSTGVVPNYYARYGDGSAFAPTKATNHEVGVKFDLMNGRLSGTVSAYKIEREGTPKYLWWAPSPYNSEKAGYDPNLPASTVWSYPNPDSIWYGIHNTPDGLRVAKEIWPSGFWSTIDAIAAVPGSADNPNSPDGSIWNLPGTTTWWDWTINPETGRGGLMREGEFGMNTESTNGGYFFPLVNMSNPEHAAFANAAKVEFTGWGGNWFYNNGQTYHFGDGTAGTGNAPTGSGADVAINDQAKGFDATFIFSPTDQLSITANYAYVKREITTPTYRFSSAPYWPFGWWMVRDGNFGTLSYNRTAAEAYEDVTDTTTYRAPIPEYQQSMDDTPKHSASVWVRYSFDRIDRLKGLSAGVGGYWEDKRMWFTGFVGNVVMVDSDGDGERELVQLWTEDKLTMNLWVEYGFQISEKYRGRVALNVDNVLNDQGRYGEVFARGTSWRLTSGISF